VNKSKAKARQPCWRAFAGFGVLYEWRGGPIGPMARAMNTSGLEWDVAGQSQPAPAAARPVFSTR